MLLISVKWICLGWFSQVVPYSPWQTVGFSSGSTCRPTHPTSEEQDGLKSSVQCYICKEEGHKAYECKSRGKRRCFRCEGYGHEAKDCVAWKQTIFIRLMWLYREREMGQKTRVSPDQGYVDLFSTSYREGRGAIWSIEPSKMGGEFSRGNSNCD